MSIFSSKHGVLVRAAGRRLVVFVVALGALSGMALAIAPAANAEPSAVRSTWTSCPALAVTCTRYWSVPRTKEFNNEEKAIQMGAYGVPAATLGLVAVAATSTGIGAPLGVAAGTASVYSTYKIAEFDTQLSSAANDSRCLIYKFPKGVVDAGWWESVSANTNSGCKKANEKDKDIFK